MSHRIVGLDIGSHSIKVLQVRSSMRNHEIERFDEEPLRWKEEADESDSEERDEAASEAGQGTRGSAAAQDLDRAIEALRARGSLTGDMLVVSYGLDHCLLTELKLPFSQRRQIETVLPIQIEDAFPVDIDELQTDFQLVGPPEPGGERRVQVAATPVAHFAPFLNRLVRHDLDPRVIEVGGARLLGAAKALGIMDSGTPKAVVDIGAQFTDVCIVRDREIRHLRRLRHGGRDVTNALAAAFKLDPEQAELGKVREGFVPLHPQPGRDDEATVGDVCREVALRLARELRHTLHGYAAQRRELVEDVYLCGGGALLRGLPELLAAELGVSVRILSVPGAVSREPGGEVRAVGAMGLVARGLPQRVGSEFNLRRGRFAFRGDFEFLRARAVALLVLVVLVIGAGLFMMISERRAVAARRQAYASVLGNMSQAILGERLNTPDAVFSKIGERTDTGPYIPENSAYEIFRDISQRLVEVREEFEYQDGGTLEIERIYVDIHGDRAQVQGATHSAAAVDFLKLELEALACLEGVNTGRTAQNRATGLYEFRIDARNVCD